MKRVYLVVLLAVICSAAPVTAADLSDLEALIDFDTDLISLARMNPAVPDAEKVGEGSTAPKWNWWKPSGRGRKRCFCSVSGRSSTVPPGPNDSPKGLPGSRRRATSP